MIKREIFWRKSSRSEPGDVCVELGYVDGAPVIVRDTKDRNGAWLEFSPETIRMFLDGVKRDHCC